MTIRMTSELLGVFRKPLDKGDFRVIAAVGVLGVLFGAALGFAAVPRWGMAAVGALLALPGSLFGAALSVVIGRAKQQMHPQTTSTSCCRNGVPPKTGSPRERDSP
jgi:hypothetical protein